MMESKGLPGKFWGEAVNTAVYLLNRVPTRSMVGGTPYEAWYGRKPSVDHLRTFGCVAHVKTVSGHKRNLVNRSTPMIMTGYEEGSKAYRLCNPSTNKVIVTCDVVFEEDLSWIWNSTEPDDIFTVVHSKIEHADDLPGKDVDPRTGQVAGDTHAAQVTTRRAGPCAAASCDGAVELCPGSDSRRPGRPEEAAPVALPARPRRAEADEFTPRKDLSTGGIVPGAMEGRTFVAGAAASMSPQSRASPGQTEDPSAIDAFLGGPSVAENRQDGGSSRAALTGPEESNGSAGLGGIRPVQIPLVQLEADIPVRRHMCLELIDLAIHELAHTWVCYGQKHPSEELANFASNFSMNASVNLSEKVLRRGHIGESRRSEVCLQPANEEPSSDETNALSGAEEYVVLSPTALETRQLRPTQARMRRVLDYYPKKVIRTVNNPVKMKHTKQCLFIEEPVKTEDADKDCRREALEKPAKVRSVTWVPRGAAKAMPMKTPAENSWRIWDPGRDRREYCRVWANIRTAAKVLDERRYRNGFSSVVLLSDGQDNCTLTRQALGSGPPNYAALVPPSFARTGTTTGDRTAPIHTFGFGRSHDAAAMHVIAEASGGTFSFIENEAVIQDAFAQCVGGLLSVVVQDARLAVACVHPGVRVVSVKSGVYESRVDEDGRAASVAVGELYADEERRFLLFLAVPAAGETDGEVTTLLKVSCVYRDATAGVEVSVTAEDTVVARPEPWF
ncbi:hypothetical protein QYE76_044937 [Lolium multiflorum]|uniref:Retroviral polymerase SH3-like domain-containing protein n=1 Tax=Lolium multiflorum TaxID=4521 RepID=A0AAD8TLZ5_LOLMU|nr:hypothetical protein QYE76_044937 [Lolium multiflorum]